LFHQRNAVCRPSKQVVSAHPNLDKHDRASIPHNEIDLAEWATEIPFHQYEVLPPQKLLRALLCFLSVQHASYKFTSQIPADFENLPSIGNINPNADLPTQNRATSTEAGILQFLPYTFITPIAHEVHPFFWSS
jgi:hypothetical protein